MRLFIDECLSPSFAIELAISAMMRFTRCMSADAVSSTTR